MTDLKAPLTVLKGIGDKNAKLFDACGVRTVGELLTYWPRAYDHFEVPVTPDTFRAGERVAVRCRLVREPALRYVRRFAILTADAACGTEVFHVTWFNQPYLKRSLYAGREYVLRGILAVKGASFVLEQPSIYAPEEYAQIAGKYLPRYPLVRGLKNTAVIRAVRQALESADPGTGAVPEAVSDKRGFLSYQDAIRMIHFPPDDGCREQARRRLAYGELFLFLTGLGLMKRADELTAGGIRMQRCPEADDLVRNLPYSLTGAQQRVLEEILAQMESGQHVHRLIQGDVGSGKTILALLFMLTAVTNGCQAALMAPTQVLAAQHYETFVSMTEKYHLPLHPVLLSGTCTAAQRRNILASIENGEADCVIGTNALMQDAVSYHKLGLVITDEQHRFGVRQREKLAGKGERPHIIVMSATPIPRTLALILYGDLEVSVLDEMPASRKRIKNALVGPEYRPKAYKFIAEQVAAGHQAYVICPMIEEGETEGEENVKDYADKLKSALPESVRVAILHGRMKAEEKDRVMSAFAAGETDVLVSTTVVEVGVNVPNATVMMIENAERFGIAALHQLRGRVGRGEAQSYCIFVNTSDSEESEKRLQILRDSVDGFAIADQDLKLRGPGELSGVRQSGEMGFRLADIYADADLLRQASEDVGELLAADPHLTAPEHAILRTAVSDRVQMDVKTL